MRLALAAAVGLATTVAGQQAPAPVPPVQKDQLIRDAEAYLVYGSLVADAAAAPLDRTKRLVFKRETSVMSECVPTGKSIDTVWRPVVDHFKSENASTRTLSGGQPLGHSYTVASSADLTSAFKDAAKDPDFGWSGFYRRYPGAVGYFEVSAVGFDPAKTRAMVSIQHRCGALCGKAAYYLVEKVKGVWREAELPDVSRCFIIS